MENFVPGGTTMSDPVFARPKKDPEFDPKRFLPRPLFESPEMKVVRATFRAGQFIPVHAPDVHVALYIVSGDCLLYTSPSPRDMRRSRMPSSA